ncbi:MAG: hypothetical protein ABID67_00420 [Candidatus Nealsonbacteria bacterium]
MKDEKVLVIAKDIFFKKDHWQGLKTDNLEYYLDLIKNNFQFKKREEVEDDDTWQQIIPYILFNFKDKYFLYNYLEKASEKRLINDYHLGVAGHINPIDLKPGEDILTVAAEREWAEEIDYKGNILDRKFIGILNDERRKVEAVHIGLIYLFKGDSPEISVKEKDILKGKLVKFKDLSMTIKGISNWAQIILEEYLNKKHEEYQKDRS